MSTSRSLPRLAAILYTSALLALCSRVGAVLEVEITQGVEGAIPIAIAPFGGAEIASEHVDGVIESDLRNSGLFETLPPPRFPETPTPGQPPNLAAWRQAGVDYLVTGSLSPDGPGRYTVHAVLWNVLAGRPLLDFSVRAAAQALRRAGHQIADRVYQELTGERGAFDTRIAYVAVRTRPDGTRRYLLQIADSDGHNPRTVYDSPQPLLSPAWSPDGRRLAYVSFESGRAAVYVQELATGHRQQVSGGRGTRSAPAWSPDGQRLALALSVEGNFDIHVLELASGRLSRLTFGRAIDTEPVWSPDGKAIFFTSDRSGRPQVYRIAASGGPAQRITFEGRYNASPDVSPDGRWLAVVHLDRGGYRIATLDTAGGALQVLTDGRLDESPSFAPNGRLILYATEHAGRGVLAAVSRDGRVRVRLSTPDEDVREPAWGPYRHD